MAVQKSWSKDGENPSARRLFLDTNKWIDLARAWHGRDDGSAFRPALDQILAGVRCGDLEVPLACSHVLEVARQGKGDRRRRLAEVMVAVSQGRVMAPSSSLIRAIARRNAQAFFTATPPEPQPTVFGRGISLAFGEMLWADRDPATRTLLEESLDTPEGLLYCLDVTDDKLRRAGTKGARRVAAEGAARVDEARTTHKMTREERLRAYYAEAMIELAGEVSQALAQVGRTLQELLALGFDAAMRLSTENAPLYVEAQLAVSRDMHWDRGVQGNDFQDIGVLSVAMPYCDFVITEKFWTRIAQQTGLGQRYGTVVTSDLAVLEEIL